MSQQVEKYKVASSLSSSKNLRIDRGQFAFNEDPWEQIYFLVSAPILLSQIGKKEEDGGVRTTPFWLIHQYSSSHDEMSRFEDGKKKQRDNSVFLLKKPIGQYSTITNLYESFANHGYTVELQFFVNAQQIPLFSSRCLLSHCLPSSSDMFSSFSFISTDESEEKSGHNLAMVVGKTWATSKITRPHSMMKFGYYREMRRPPPPPL